MLNTLGYYPDSKVHKERRFVAALSDQSHASIASFSDFLFSRDKISLEKLGLHMNTLASLLKFNTRDISGHPKGYMIDVRYNDKCCSEDAKYWLEQISSEAQNYGKGIGEALTNQIENRKTQPLNNYNFLRVPFLEAYKRDSSF